MVFEVRKVCKVCKVCKVLNHSDLPRKLFFEGQLKSDHFQPVPEKYIHHYSMSLSEHHVVGLRDLPAEEHRDMYDLR